MEKVPNKILRDAALSLMAKNGKTLTKLPSRGRSMLYRMEDSDTVRVRTCNDHILIAVANSPSLDAKLNIEGTDWLLIAMPETPRTPGKIISYLIPTQVAVEEVRKKHREWLESNPNTKGENTTWNLWFDNDGPDKACGYHEKWSKYRLEGEDSSAKVVANGNEASSSTNSIRTTVDAARKLIADTAGVPVDAVRISIDFQF